MAEANKLVESKLYDINEALDLIKKNSRHYAKRQYTWFKNQMDVKWFKLDKCYDETYKEIIAYLEGK